MMVMVVGEISNIFMVPWHASRFCEWDTVSYVLSFPTTIIFSICRIFIAPFYSYVFWVEATTTDHGVPALYLNFYMISFVALLIGSWVWTYSLIKGFIKHTINGVPLRHPSDKSRTHKD